MPKPRANEPYLTYNLILHERQMKQLRAIAHQRGVTIALIIREMLDKHLQQEYIP